MEFKVKWKAGISGILATFILMGSLPSYGAKLRFVDVPEKHWAYSHIDNMAKLGHLNGKGNNQFDPSGNMTFMEALAAFSRLSRPTSEDKKNALKKYEGLLKELKVTQAWEKEAISLALYQDMVTENDVRRAKPIYHKPIQKVAASVLLAKAVGLEEKATNMNVIFLDYKDVTQINDKDRRYVKTLLDVGILDKKGDGTGKFHPKQALRREVMATLMDNAHKYLLKNPLEKDPVQPKEEDKPTNPNVEIVKPSGIKETMDVKVDRITKEIGRNFLVVRTNSGKELSFPVDGSTDIRVDGDRAQLGDLSQGLEITIEYDSDTKDLYSVRAKFERENLTGVLKSIDKASLVIDYKDGSRNSSKTLSLGQDLRVKKDGETASQSSLSKGDVLSLSLVNGKVSEINATKPELKLTGELDKLTRDRDGQVELRVKTKDGQSYKLLANRDSYVERDGDKSSYDKLRETDRLVVVAKYSLEDQAYVAEDIKADVVSEKIVGYVTEITNKVGKNPIVRVKIKDRDQEEDFELLSGAYIKVDGKTAKTLPSNPGYEVELYVEGKTDIKEAYVDTLTMETSLVGKIESMDTRDEYIEIRLSNLSNKDRDIVRIYIDDDTRILDRRFNDIKFNRLYRGDYVNIVGVYKGSNFIANTIQLRD